MSRSLLFACAGLFLALALFPSLFAPYEPSERNAEYRRGAPMVLRFAWGMGFYVEGRVTERDPESLGLVTIVQPEIRWNLEFFPVDKQAFLGFRILSVREGFVHLFGTDDLGRDLLSRVIHSIPTSFVIATGGALITVMLGFLLAAISLRFGSLGTGILFRFAESIRSVPTIPIWIGLAAAMPQNWTSVTRYAMLVLIFSLISWPHSFARIRSLLSPLFVEPRYFYYVKRGMVPTLFRAIRYFAPVLGPFLVFEFLIQIPYLVIGETTLSFLGFGVAEPDLTFGVLFSKIRSLNALIETPWYFLAVAAFCLILILLFGLADLSRLRRRAVLGG